MTATKVAPVTPAASSSPPVATARTLVAKVPGACAVCGGSVEKGPRVRAEGQRTRGHPGYMIT